MTDQTIDVYAPCDVCSPLRLGVPLNWPHDAVEECADCGATARPRGVWRDDDGADHLHFECEGTLTASQVDADGTRHDVRTHHHFDMPFEVRRDPF